VQSNRWTTTSIPVGHIHISSKSIFYSTKVEEATTMGHTKAQQSNVQWTKKKEDIEEELN
jgi:hypothetical protein